MIVFRLGNVNPGACGLGRSHVSLALARPLRFVAPRSLSPSFALARTNPVLTSYRASTPYASSLLRRAAPVVQHRRRCHTALNPALPGYHGLTLDGVTLAKFWSWFDGVRRSGGISRGGAGGVYAGQPPVPNEPCPTVAGSGIQSASCGDFAEQGPHRVRQPNIPRSDGRTFQPGNNWLNSGRSKLV